MTAANVTNPAPDLNLRSRALSVQLTPFGQVYVAAVRGATFGKRGVSAIPRRPCDVLSRRVSGAFIEKESCHVARECVQAFDGCRAAAPRLAVADEPLFHERGAGLTRARI